MPASSMGSFVVHQHQVSSSQKRYTVVSISCQMLTDAGFVHAFSTRGGGISPMPSGALNFSDLGDSVDRVKENKKRFLDSLNLKGWPIVLGHQIHSDRCHVVPASGRYDQVVPDVDALMTKRAHILLGVKTADCVPVLIADPRSGWCAVVHAGWRGTLEQITAKAVCSMVKKGASSKSMIAVVGPAACGRCYEVGAEIKEAFKKKIKNVNGLFRRSVHGTFLFDAQKANKKQLIESGIKPSRIYVAPFCTMHHEKLFFSHRRESKNRYSVGRQISVIGKID